MIDEQAVLTFIWNGSGHTVTLTSLQRQFGCDVTNAVIRLIDGKAVRACQQGENCYTALKATL